MTSLSLLETSTSHELFRGLDAQLKLHFGREPHIERLCRRPLVASTSSAIEELDVFLSDGTTLGLIAKDVGPGGMVGCAGQVKPRFLRNPLREIEVYRTFLSRGDLGTPRFFGAIIDPPHRYVLFLERLGAAELHEMGSISVWADVARWLARLHSGRLGAVAVGHPCLISYDADYFRRWPARAQRTMERDRSGRTRRRSLARLVNRYEDTVEALTSLPTTLVHGDLYSSNVLVVEGSSQRRVCPVDWEMAGFGPGLLDLAALTSGDWTEEERWSLVNAYTEALAPTPGWPPARAELAALLDHCDIYLAMQWMGWSSNWKPPSRHARDWLGVAQRAGDRIGL